MDNYVGFGWGQLKVFLMYGFITMLDSTLLLVIGFLNPILEN